MSSCHCTGGLLLAAAGERALVVAPHLPLHETDLVDEAHRSVRTMGRSGQRGGGY